MINDFFDIFRAYIALLLNTICAIIAIIICPVLIPIVYFTKFIIDITKNLIGEKDYEQQ